MLASFFSLSPIPKSSTMKTPAITTTTLLLSSLLLSLSLLVSCDSPPSSTALQDKCAPEFTKLGECLSYATGKADAPTTPCCGSVTEIRAKDAVCLCYIIQQAHAGGTSVTSLGLRFDRLTSLPSACKLANTKISDCPKLLNLPPNSPDNAIFTDATKASTTPTGPSGTSSNSSSSSPSSGGVMNTISCPRMLTLTLVSALCVAIF